MQSVLLAGSSSTPVEPAKVIVVTKKLRKVKIEEDQTPLVHYNQLSGSMRKEINNKVGDFYNSLSEFATSNGLNPVDVTRYALGGELKGLKMNSWRCFQRLSGMERARHKCIGVVNSE
jgi:hypothetical protein